MAENPLGKKPGAGRPEIWASGGQRPPFDLRALGRAGLHLSSKAVAPFHAWAARGLRRAAVNVKNGAGRIPADKLGRAARFVPSHLRVAGWMKNLAATLSHASATADPDITRGNALVAEIAPHLWDSPAPPDPAPGPAPAEVGPVSLPEPEPADDPLASIRGEMGRGEMGWAAEPGRPRGPDEPPAPPGPLADGAIQVSGYLIGWGSTILLLPFGVLRALWLWVSGRDLRKIGAED